ncbi:MAG: putative DNA primase/helicase [Gammaproteobacteria bacterium]|jgi:putative DNA primase/helicase
MPDKNKILKYAQIYMGYGWPVLPVSSKTKRPLIPSGSLGASTDIDQLFAWYETFPNAILAIATGKFSELIIVDIDIRPDRNGWDSLEQKFGDNFDVDMENNLVSRTATGGVHLVYKYKDGIKNAQDILPGIDIRGDGGYFIAPPSERFINGKWIEYEWKHIELDIPDIPDWLDELIENKKSSNVGHNSTVSIKQIIQRVQQGCTR